MRRFLLAFLLLLLIAAPVLRAQDVDDPNITVLVPLVALSGTVELRGTIAPPNMQAYFFEVAPAAQASDPAAIWTPVTLPGGSAVTNGVLGSINTLVLADGSYVLRVRVLLTGGGQIIERIAPITIQNAGRITPTPEIPPTPTIAPTPTLVPRPNPINELPVEVGGQLADFDDNAVEFMRQAGMTWIKWQIPYTLGDDSILAVVRDRVNWTHAHGFRVLLSVKGSRDELGALGEEYFPAFADRLAQFAAFGPDAIQVWNEQNLDREWPQGQIDPRMYVEMLRQAYDAIKAVDPTIRVITGAPAPTGAEGAFGLDRVWNDDRYYLGMANGGAAEYSDCIGIHYNEGILPPSSLGGDPRGEYPTYYFGSMIQRAFFPFRQAGFPDEPFCFSEMGYLSPDGYGQLPSGFAWGQNTSVAEQAAWLRDAIRQAGETTSPRIDLIIVFNVNFTRFVDGDPQGGFAIIRPDGSCPACETIAELRGA